MDADRQTRRATCQTACSLCDSQRSSGCSSDTTRSITERFILRPKSADQRCILHHQSDSPSHAALLLSARRRRHVLVFRDAEEVPQSCPLRFWPRETEEKHFVAVLCNSWMHRLLRSDKHTCLSKLSSSASETGCCFERKESPLGKKLQQHPQGSFKLFLNTLNLKGFIYLLKTLIYLDMRFLLRQNNFNWMRVFGLPNIISSSSIS